MTLAELKKHKLTVWVSLTDDEAKQTQFYMLRLGETVFRYFTKPKKEFTIDGRVFMRKNFFKMLKLVSEGGGSIIKEKNDAGRTATK